MKTTSERSGLRILFATMPIPGHVRPGLAIARELVRRGNQVSWYTGREFAATIERTGSAFAPIAASLEPDAERRPWLAPPDGPQSGLRKLRRDIRHGFLGSVPSYLDDLRKVFDELRPDVVVADQGFIAAPLLAELRDVPRVIYTVTPLTLSSPDTAPFGTGLAPATTALGRLRNRALDRVLRHVVFGDSQRAAKRLRRTLGLPSLGGYFLDWGPATADRYLHTTVPEFEYPRRTLPENVEFVGTVLPDAVDAWRPPAWWPRLADARRRRSPVVLVTQGTIATDPGNLLLPAVEALAHDDVLLVATTGGRDPEAVLPRARRPANVELEAFVPFTEALPFVDVMVTNGGYGGVQAALAHGIPLVVAGTSEDKMEVSARVAWSGAGISLATDRPTPSSIAGAVRAVLNTPSYRREARRLRDAYACCDAAARAADSILAAAANRQGAKSSASARALAASLEAAAAAS